MHRKNGGCGPSLAAEQDHDGGHDHHDCGDARERCGVAELFCEEGLTNGGSGSQQDAQLIGEAREQPANLRRRELVQMRRDTPHAPCTMNCIRKAPAVSTASVEG